MAQFAGSPRKFAFVSIALGVGLFSRGVGKGPHGRGHGGGPGMAVPVIGTWLLDGGFKLATIPSVAA